MLGNVEKTRVGRASALRGWVFALAWLSLGGVAAQAEAGWIGRIDRGLGRVVTPGGLARAHAHLDGVSGCASCHAGLQGTPDEKCNACHEVVVERLQAGIGVHGEFRDACRSCHLEHRGAEGDLLGLDRAAFNHDRALFALRGAHAALACERCHLRADPETGAEAFHAIGVAYETCDACHADPHSEAMRAERACSECHSEFGWSDPHLVLSARGSDAGFDHTRDTRFALAGRHIALECRSCHTLERAELEKREQRPPGRGTPSACGSCHEDVHRTALADDCARCHSSVAWKGPESPFAHDLHTKFALDQTHAGVACRECHEDARFQVVGTRCEDCHRDAASLVAGHFEERTGSGEVHRLRLVCADCHDGSIAAPRLLDHERRCVACHTPEYGQLLLTRRRILDELVVRSEAALRARQLAERRGEGAADGDLSQTAARIDRLARSGIHNADLAEAVLRAVLEGLRAPGSQPEPSS
jgi:hypothetical protein